MTIFHLHNHGMFTIDELDNLYEQQLDRELRHNIKTKEENETRRLDKARERSARQVRETLPNKE